MENLPFSEANFLILLSLVDFQSKQIAILTEENAFLKSRIKELEGRLNQDSSNSSKPPSSDGFKKRIVNLRKKSGKKPGGQQGHKGKTLEMSSVPDEVILHLPTACGCGYGKKDWKELSVEVAQVVDIPRIKAKVTEHRKITCQCKICGVVSSGSFPEGVVPNKAQYGAVIQSLAVYFNQYHFIPYQRLAEIFSDCFGTVLSEGSLVNFIKKTGGHLLSFEKHLRQALLSSTVLHSDETGIRCEGKTRWVHTLSNERLTYYQLDEHRGTKALDRIGLLPNYMGHLVHDRYASYFQYDEMSHSLCNAHLLRDLKYLEEQEACCWAKDIKDLLLKAKEYKKQNPVVRTHYKTRITNQFQKLVQAQLKKEERKMKKYSSRSPASRGKPKRSKAHNLLLALAKHQQAILCFITEPDVPFDNNLAERDLRMIKTKQKVSGCFRSEEGGNIFCLIRSYLSTLRKNNQNILQGIQDAFNAKAFMTT